MPHVCVSAHVLRARTCVRCRAHGYQHRARATAEASKSETKGAHTAILDSIVIKRGATAARAGRCIAVAAVAVVVVVVVALVYGVRANERRHFTALMHSRHSRDLRGEI